MELLQKQFSYAEELFICEKKTTNIQLVVHGSYSSISIYRTEFSAFFREIIEIPPSKLKIFIYSISRGSPNNILPILFGKKQSIFNYVSVFCCR
jgi:hypothetical protein